MIIGIGGISNAGKSGLALKIKEHFSDRSVEILCQDDFVKPVSQIPKINGHTDWETPESIDFNRYYNHLISKVKQYDIIIDEGLFVFFDQRLVKLYDKSIFMTLSKETFFNRKEKDLRWGREPGWYIDHIWNSHQKFIREIHLHDTVYLCPGENPVDYESVFEYLNDQMLKKS